MVVYFYFGEECRLSETVIFPSSLWVREVHENLVNKPPVSGFSARTSSSDWTAYYRFFVTQLGKDHQKRVFKLFSTRSEWMWAL